MWFLLWFLLWLTPFFPPIWRWPCCCSLPTKDWGNCCPLQKREVHGSPLPQELQPEWQLPAWCPRNLWGGRCAVQVSCCSCCLCGHAVGTGESLLGASVGVLWEPWVQGLDPDEWVEKHSQFCVSSFSLLFTPWENSWSLCLGSPICGSKDTRDAAALTQPQAWLQPSSVSLWSCPPTGLSLLPHPSSVLAGSRGLPSPAQTSPIPSGDSSGNQIPVQL